MPSLNLSPDQVSQVICLPGTALIRCLKPKMETESGLAIPEAAASWEQENKAIREGEIVTYTLKGHPFVKHPTYSGPGCAICGAEARKHIDPGDTIRNSALSVGSHVYYLGRQDERHDEYVVVKIGQIVAVKEPKNASM